MKSLGLKDKPRRNYLRKITVRGRQVCNERVKGHQETGTKRNQLIRINSVN